VKNILAKGQRTLLEEFAAAGPLLAFGFDGALAPVKDDPRAAQLRKSTQRVLAKVAERYRTVVLSSRPRADVLARLTGVRVNAVVGNHGLEPSPDAQRYHAIVKNWMPLLREMLEGTSGVELENKLYSIAIHYRGAKSESKALHAIKAALAKLGPDARAIQGKLVIDIVPAAAPSKGSALLALRRSLAAESTIFVGGDASDEDVYAADQPPQLLGIRVGRPKESEASYYLSDQRAIDELLELLVELPAN
jgi:trehalose 6-phosphate phosphatase